MRSLKLRGRSVLASLILLPNSFFLVRPMAAINSDLLAQTEQPTAGLSIPAQTQPEIRVLMQGQPIERELKGGEAHSYAITLSANQYLQVVVDQRGVDVVVRVFGPDGKQIMEVDSPNGTEGPEPVFLVAEVAGSYRLEVRSLEKEAKPGRYEVRVEELRAATPQDRSRMAAQKAYAEGELLSAQGAAQARRQAIEKYQESLSHWRVLGDRAREAETLNQIGRVHDSLGEKQQALDYYNQALPLHRALGDRAWEATVLNNIGRVYNSLGEKQKALDYYNQALPLFHTVGSRAEEAIMLSNIGFVYANLGEQQKALDYYNQALPLHRAVGGRAWEAGTLYRIASTERDSGNLTAARARIEDALQLLEFIRVNIASQELRASYFATVQDFYDFYIDLLMRLHQQDQSQGHAAAALQATERARARSLLELLAEAHADIRQGVDPDLLSREQSLQQQINAKAELALRLKSNQRTEQQAAALDKEIDQLTTEFQQVQAEIREKSPHYATLTQPQPLSLAEIQAQVLDSETLLLEYALGEERSCLWAVTQTSVQTFTLPKREEIKAAAQRVYALLTARNSSQRKLVHQAQDKPLSIAEADAEYWKAATALSHRVLGPVAAQLGKKRLLIVTDGTLQYVPFAALPIPATGRPNRHRPIPLIIDHEIVSLPSASTLAVLRRELQGRQPAAKTVVTLADPVFDQNDARLKTAALTAPDKKDGPGLDVISTRILKHVAKQSDDSNEAASVKLEIPRLPFTRQEAERILALVPEAAGMKALDFKASRATATSADLSQYRFVHFATHGYLDSERPELSALVLSTVDEQGRMVDGFLRAHEVYNLNLPAELVVLSACETGLGKEVKGEGLVGLTRGFMYAGAARVMVSLWSVNDQATSELMVKFYRKVLAEGMRPAAALRAAQVEMWKEKRWQAPYYWAAFTLQGEWR